MIDTTYYKDILIRERDELVQRLKKIGVHDPTNKENWDLKDADLDGTVADKNELADKSEEMHINSIVLEELEIRYRKILRALSKIEAGTYGVCEVSGEPIEEERLQANPAARTNKVHIDKEDGLPL